YKKIGEVTYTIDWYRMSGRKSLDIVLMIAMSNTSIKFTAGNIFELSFTTFGNVSNIISMFIVCVYKNMICTSFVQLTGD
ncbi:hypothetical protein ALC56_07580, partial [Trachymyrmex septentrionalis]